MTFLKLTGAKGSDYVTRGEHKNLFKKAFFIRLLYGFEFLHTWIFNLIRFTQILSVKKSKCKI